MKQLLIIVFFCLCSALAQAEVQVQVEPSQINMGESFRFIITQDDMQGRGIPDLTPLQTDFYVLGTERSVNYSIINGQTQSSSEWKVVLKPKKTGILTIPAISIGMDHTDPITINVAATANQKKVPDTIDEQQGIILTTEVNEKKPYVNQQIIYKVTLYNSKHLLDANYQGPQVDNALLIPLGEEKRYQTQKNNVIYLVEEQNYAIFPQKSGSLKITPPVFSALVYDLNPQRVQTQAKILNLEVQPIPKSYSGKVWLPAKQIKLKEQYDHIGPSISQGSTMVRTVTIEGTGIPAQLLPQLNFAETDAFSAYPEKGKESNQVVQSELVSSTEIKVTYLFNKNGHVVIPKLNLTWFNTVTGKEEIASLDSRSIEVTPSTPGANQPTPLKSQETIPTAPPINETTAPAKNNTPWIVAGLFALAWLITLILWAWPRRKKNTQKGQHKKALNELHQACTQGPPQDARDALLKWANLHWPDAPILNLTDLTQLVSDIPLKKQIHLLSQVLYKNTEKTLWRGDELWRSVQAMKPVNTKAKSKASVLPPMNPL